MLKSWLQLTIGLLIGTSHFVLTSEPLWGQVDESVEPPIRFVVEIDGKRSPSLVAGESVEIEGEFRNPKIRVLPEPVRRFAYGGISFNYPHNFSFEADLESEFVKIWTLSGANVSVMVMASRYELTALSFLDGVIDELGPDNAEIAEEKVELKLGKHVLSGNRLKSELLSTKTLMDAYEVPSSKGHCLIVFQRTGDERQSVDEMQRLIRGVNQSFAIK